MQFLGVRLKAEKRGVRFRAGIAGEEGNQEFAGLDIWAVGERVGGDRLSQFVLGAEDDFGAEAELALDCVLDLLCQRAEFFSFVWNLVPKMTLPLWT